MSWKSTGVAFGISSVLILGCVTSEKPSEAPTSTADRGDVVDQKVVDAARHSPYQKCIEDSGHKNDGRLNQAIFQNCFLLLENRTTSKGLKPQEILGPIRFNLSQIRSCYEELLTRDKKATGKIAVRFLIGLKGNVESLEMPDSKNGERKIEDRKMTTCVKTTIQKWVFPVPRGNPPERVAVNYPFVFNPI